MEKDNIPRNEGGRTKRIAKNSFVLFVRILFITLINLFSLRYILKGLGETDYGVYNAVAGVVQASAFVIPVLAVSIQRFYNYSIGKGDRGRQKEIFSISMNIITVLSLVAVMLLETVGIWFINTHMTIPLDRMWAAHVIFQLSIFAFVFSMFQIPYTAAIFANEDMGLYAFVSSIDCALKFAVALLIALATIDSLVFYAAGLLVVAMLMFGLYAVICRRRYAECHYSWTNNRGAYGELLSFSGWTLYGAVAATGLLQGSNILLNVFFGPIANAAYGVGVTMYNAFNSLNNSVVLAFRPVMVQSYAEGKLDYLGRLFMMSNKFLYYLLLTVSLPIIFEMEQILQWWLVDVSPMTVVFCRLFIVYGICLALHNPVTTIIQATGKIRTYSLCVESITILNIPVAYGLLKMGAPAEGVFYSMIGLCLLAQCVRVVCLLHAHQGFSLFGYLWQFVAPAAIVTVAAAVVTSTLYGAIADELLRFFLVCIISPIATLLFALAIGVGKAERAAITGFITKRFIK